MSQNLEGHLPRPPTDSQIAHWITCKEDQLLEWQQKSLKHLCEADQEIREADALIQEYTTMLRKRKGGIYFDTWLQKVEQQGIAELCHFAHSLKKDYEEVKAGLPLPWSQGPVEGHVHRLKLLKRQAYGRASFQTLCKRVLQCGQKSCSREARPKASKVTLLGNLFSQLASSSHQARDALRCSPVKGFPNSVKSAEEPISFT